MAMGTPVVASPAAAEGTGAVPGEHLIVAEGAEATARAVLDVLSAPDAGAAMAARARALVRDRYGWDACLQRFARHLP
jgi:glycosyltransferase involved in cell wall biosynthesis